MYDFLSSVHQEICLCDPPVVMALVDGPTGENDNMICVAYKHQFDLINESTGDAYRLHHVDANRVRQTQGVHSTHMLEKQKTQPWWFPFNSLLCFFLCVMFTVVEHG